MRQIVINEYVWDPFAIPDASFTRGWRGIDIDLYDALGELLNFTCVLRLTPLTFGWGSRAASRMSVDCWLPALISFRGRPIETP